MPYGGVTLFRKTDSERSGTVLERQNSKQKLPRLCPILPSIHFE